MDSFWGKINIEKINTPKSILEEQAVYLKEETNKYIYADLERNYMLEKKMEGWLSHDFLIKGKYMDDFSYKLLSICHPIDLYPVHIIVDQKTYTETAEKLNGYTILGNSDTFNVNNEEEYILVLKMIFTSKRCKNLITGIISLSSKEYDFPF